MSEVSFMSLGCMHDCVTSSTMFEVMYYLYSHTLSLSLFPQIPLMLECWKCIHTDPCFNVLVCPCMRPYG